MDRNIEFRIRSFADTLKTIGLMGSDIMQLTLVMTLIRRMECCFAVNSKLILHTYNHAKALFDEEELDKEVLGNSPLPYYRKSTSTLYSLCKDGIITGFLGIDHYFEGYDKQTYLQFKECGAISLFSRIPNVNNLFSIIQTANSWDYGIYIEDSEFEEIIRYIINSLYDDRRNTGMFYIPTMIQELMSDLLITPNTIETHQSLYDPFCGLGTLLRNCTKKITIKNGELTDSIGQDANSLIMFNDLITKACTSTTSKTVSSHLRCSKYFWADSLSLDETKDQKFDYIISNLPISHYNIQYSPQLNAQRFPKGMNVDINSMFIRHIIDKLAPQKGRAVFTCSLSFFISKVRSTADTRTWLIEEDYIDSIIILPMWGQVNGAMNICICVLDLNKSEERQGSVQLIYATDLFTKYDGRTIFTQEAHDEILREYFNQDKTGYSRVIKKESLMAYTLDVLQPKRDEKGEIMSKNGKTVFDKKKTVKVELPVGESDLLGYLNKNVISHLDPKSEIDFSSVMKTSSIPVNIPPVIETKVQQLDFIESEAKKIEHEIKRLFNIIFEPSNSYSVAEDTKLDADTCLLNSIAKITRSRTGQGLSTRVKNEYPIISVKYIKNGIDDRQNYVLEKNAFVHVEDGDIVIVSTGKNAGEVLLAKKGVLSSSLLKVEITNQNVDKNYLFMLLKSMEQWLRVRSAGGVMKNLRISDLNSMQFRIPSLEEQHRVVNSVKEKINSIDQLLPMLGGKAQETMINYRQTLITEALK